MVGVPAAWQLLPVGARLEHNSKGVGTLETILPDGRYKILFDRDSKSHNYEVPPAAATRLLQDCHMAVTRLLNDCYLTVAWLLHGAYRAVTGRLQGDLSRRNLAVTLPSHYRHTAVTPPSHCRYARPTR